MEGEYNICGAAACGLEVNRSRCLQINFLLRKIQERGKNQPDDRAATQEQSVQPCHKSLLTYHMHPKRILMKLVSAHA